MQKHTKNIKNELDLKSEFAEGITKVISYSEQQCVYLMDRIVRSKGKY